MQQSNFTMRQGRAPDARRLHDLHTASVRAFCRGHYTSEVIDAWLANRRPESYLPPIDRGDLFVVEDNSHIVGFGEAVRGMIIAVYVDPGSVRHGVGSAIMHQALKVARQEHHTAIRLESTLNAIGFYERFGFREVERSSVIRGQVAVPVVVMERQET